MQIKIRTGIIFLCVIVIIAVAIPGLSAVPGQINYQGQLTDKMGVPVANDTYTMRFYLFDAQTGGNQLWNTSPDGEEQNVIVIGGIYNVQLGALDPLDYKILDSGTVWLEVAIYNSFTSQWETMYSRQPITSVAYALKAGDADTLEGNTTAGLDARFVNEGQAGAVTSAMIQNNSITASKIAADAVGSSEVAKDSITAEDIFDGPKSDLNADYLDDYDSSYFMTAATDNWVNITGDTMIGRLTTNTAGRGIMVDANPINTTLYGVSIDADQSSAYNYTTYGLHIDATSAASSATTYGIYSTASGNGSTYGIYAAAFNGVENYAGYFVTGTDTSIPVVGLQSGNYIVSDIGSLYEPGGLFGGRNGVIGFTEYPNGVGVYGKGTGDDTKGVLGIANGDDTKGVSGTASGDKVYGIYGFATAETGEVEPRGVYGLASGTQATGGYFYGAGTNAVGIYAYGTQYAADFNGNVRIRNGDTIVMELGQGLDYAEGFNISDIAKPDPGSVLIIDPDNPGKLTISNTAYDTKVAGIVAGANGLGSGVRLGGDQFDNDVALAGRVYCKVDASCAAVKTGDLLTTSNLSGYAMKAKDYSRAQGAILGKAMQDLKKGTKGQILVLVTLQ